MADSFFKFVEQEHPQTHLNLMSAGQILVLCFFHSRLCRKESFWNYTTAISIGYRSLHTLQLHK